MAISHVNANDCEGLKNLITNIMESDGNKPIARAGMSAVSALLDQEVNTFCAENGRPRLFPGKFTDNSLVYHRINTKMSS